MYNYKESVTTRGSRLMQSTKQVLQGYRFDKPTSDTSGTIVLGRLIGSSLVESFTNSYTLTDPNGTEEKYT